MTGVLRAVGVLAVAALLTCSMTGTAASQEEMRGFGQTKMIPITDAGLGEAKVAVEVGTIIVWSNISSFYINIFFSGGKEVERACAAPTRFFLAQDGMYGSGVIPPGAVASLCFPEEGSYQYHVTGPKARAGRLIKGEITVGVSDQ